MLNRLFFSIILINISFPCAVCYGNVDSPMSHGMNMGILTLLTIIGFVLSIIAISILSIYLKSKKMNKG